MFDPEDIILDEIAVTSEDVSEESEIRYPHVLISNILTAEDFKFLQQSLSKSYGDCVDLWVSLQEERELIGEICLNLENVSMLKYMGYQSSLFLPDRREVDMCDANLFHKFLGI